MLTHPPEGWQGETGCVTAEILGKYLPKQFRRFAYFVCGPCPMIDAMAEALPKLSVPPESVHTERFEIV